MRPSVRELFVRFTSPLEGVVSWMYQDVKGLVSTGIGNLIDPVELALPLPFVHRGTDIPADERAIRAEWENVKRYPDAARLGHLALKDATSLRLTDEGIAQVVGKRLDLNDQILRQRFPDFEQWPADAQLATHSMAWACGPMFRFPKLEAALKARDFSTAATECYMNSTGNPGLKPRNLANKALYMAAADPNRNDDAVTWVALTLIDARKWPRNADVPTEPCLPANDIIHPELYDPDDEPPEAA